MEYGKFHLSIRREDDKWNADVTPLQLKAIRCSQWTMAWYEDLILRLIDVIDSLVNENIG